MLVPSAGFKVINARGFGNTTNVRFVQMVDGVDNQAPHLGAPIANMLGPSDLDIHAIEILPGTASALYGMNAINGIANFITKDPFTSEGFTLQQKIGINRLNQGVSARPFNETSLRYVKAIAERLALKFNGTFVRGTDWVANDGTDLNPRANESTGLSGNENPAFDPVNSYGNESPNRRTLSLGGKNYIVARTGYFESEVVDYSIQNIKADAAFHYRVSRSATVGYTYRFAAIDNIYQRSNRFRLEDYLLQQHGLFYKSDALKANVYLNVENTGKSYNARSMAENIDRSFKTDDQWFNDYRSAYMGALEDGLTVADAHKLARGISDFGRPVPGTETFDEIHERLSSVNNWDIGAALRVKATVLHSDFQYELTSTLFNTFKTQTGVSVLIGSDYRNYIIIPDGNYFINPIKDNENLTYRKTGAFVQVSKDFKEKLKLTATVRADKNEFYSLKWNPRFTTVYSLNRSNHIRASYQNGYRFPSVFEAFSNVNSGGVKRVGGLPVMSNGIFENAYKRASIDAFQNAILKDVNQTGITRTEAIAKNQNLLVKNDYTYMEPERIRSLELGYRSSFLDNDLVLDVDYYFNRYQDFIAQVEMNIPKTTIADSIPFYLSDRRKQNRYRMWTNSKTIAYNLDLEQVSAID